MRKKSNGMDIRQYHKNCAVCRNYKDFNLPDELVSSIYDVVLFIGSGVSTESRTAFPDTFYSLICEELKINPKKNIPFSKVMSLYCKKTGGKHELLNKIKERFDYFKAWPELYMRATDFHRELALLPCIDKIVTTNWDDYLEVETNATPFVDDRDIIFWDSPGKKVLKIHGSINSLGSIVATEEDYNKCYLNLQKGVIGSQIKLFIAKNIIVFIGYSFNDIDFQKIYKIISKRMEAYKKQAYIITLDKRDDKFWKKMGLIPIKTDGTYFIHKLRKTLEEKGCVLPVENLPRVIAIKDYINKIHDETTRKYKHYKYPEIIYCLSYQDGVLHALDYLMNKIKYAYSLCTKNLINSIDAYEALLKKYKKNWLEHSYLNGYLGGLYYFNSALLPEIKISNLPIFPYYNEVTKEKYIDEKDFRNSLKRCRKNRALEQKLINSLKKLERAKM